MNFTNCLTEKGIKYRIFLLFRIIFNVITLVCFNSALAVWVSSFKVKSLYFTMYKKAQIAKIFKTIKNIDVEEGIGLNAITRQTLTLAIKRLSKGELTIL